MRMLIRSNLVSSNESSTRKNMRNKKRKFLRKEKIIELPLFEESNTKEHKVKKKEGEKK